jgi:hypothetical protein
MQRPVWCSKPLRPEKNSPTVYGANQVSGLGKLQPLRFCESLGSESPGDRLTITVLVTLSHNHLSHFQVPDPQNLRKDNICLLISAAKFWDNLFYSSRQLTQTGNKVL